MGTDRRFDHLTAMLVVVSVSTCASPASVARADPTPVTPRVVGGSPTTIQSWPWQVAVTQNPALYEGSARDRLVCGGSLVTARIFISAAHCFFEGNDFEPASEFAAVSGRTRLSSAEGQESPVATYHYFVDQNGSPLYEPGSTRWDVVLVELAAHAAGSPIRIAGPGERDLWAEGRTAYVTGWGRLGDGTFPDELHAAPLAITSDADCAAAWPDDFFADVTVCAFATGRDTCAGDSGGPLVVPAAGGQMRLVGDSIGGSNPCGGPLPGIYGRLADDPLRSMLRNMVLGLAGVDIVGSGAQPSPPPPSAGISRRQALNLSWRLAKRICDRLARCLRRWAGSCGTYRRDFACWIRTFNRNRQGRRFTCRRRVLWVESSGGVRRTYLTNWRCRRGW